MSAELGFWISIVSGIPDSLSCIPDSKAQDSGYHKQNFIGFWIPQANLNFPHFGFRVSLQRLVWSHANNPIVAVAFCAYNTCFVCSETRAAVLMSLRCGVLAFSSSQDVRSARNDKYTRTFPNDRSKGKNP